MNASHPPQARTRTVARLLGPYLTIVAVVVALRAPDMRGLLDEFTGSVAWSWVTGALVLFAGIAIVAFHQIWRGVAAIVISTFGWALVARGVFLMAFPEAFASLANRVIGATHVWQAVCVVFALVGGYLVYVGWWTGADVADSAGEPRNHR